MNMTVLPLSGVVNWSPSRYWVNDFLNDSSGGLASVFINFAFIQFFQSSGIEDLRIWVNERSLRLDFESTVSTRIHSLARDCHHLPRLAHGSLACPTSLDRYFRGVGMPRSPSSLVKWLVYRWISALLLVDIPVSIRYIQRFLSLTDNVIALAFDGLRYTLRRVRPSNGGKPPKMVVVHWQGLYHVTSIYIW